MNRALALHRGDILPEFYTVQEVAQILRMDEETVRRYINKGRLHARKTPDGELISMISDGKIRACKIGKRWLIPRIELEKLFGLELFDKPEPPKRRKTMYELAMEL